MRKLIFVLMAFVSVPGFAGVTGSGTIKYLQNAYGGWVFAVNATSNNPENCSKSSMILVNHSQQKEIYSLILAAYTTAKPAIFYTSGCDSNGYNIVTGIFTSWNAP